MCMDVARGLAAMSEWSPGKWQFTAEALRERDERKGQGVDLDDLPSAVGLGASVSVRWRFAARRELTARYEYPRLR